MEPAQPHSLSRQVSLCMAMQSIIHCGPISRASISKQTGLSKQTVSELVRILEEDGWVRETGRTSGHVGRTATTYELVTDSAFMAAVDLGGTKLRVAIVDLAGSVISEVVAPTDAEGGQAVASQIGTLVKAALTQAGVDPGKVRQTVVGCPGVPDQETGAVKYAPNIRGIDAIDFRAAVAQVTGTPVLLENDVNLAVLGEQWLGAGQGIQADPDLSDRTAHMAACFADAAASLAFLASGGRREAIEEYAALRQASLHFGYFPGTGEFREGVLVDATHRAIREALTARITDGMGAREIVSAAVRIARRTAFPSSRFTLGPGGPTTEEAAEAAYAAEAVGRDLRDASRSEVEEMAVRYRRDLRALVEEHSGSEESSARMLAFGSVHIPMRMSSVFEDETAPLPVHRDKAVASAAEEVAKRDRLAARIVARCPKPSDADAIEFGEPSPGM